MSWRNIAISQKASISLNNNNLVIKINDEKYYVPLEDIATIMIDNLQVNITSALLSECAKYHILIYICDNSHLPIGLFTSINTHSRYLKMINYQLEVSSPFKKRLWKEIVSTKIYNQSLVLKYLALDNYDKIIHYSKIVTSGDVDNTESIAANIYFKSLFGKEFNRRKENTINASLNYGYSIIRGAIARSLTIYGFLPVLGIHHHSELNDFNLVDDIIEPFRPIVDLWVYKNINEKSEFTTMKKYELYNLLNHEIKIFNSTRSVLNSIDLVVKSLSSAYQNKNYELANFPELLPLKLHKYE